MKSIWTKVKAYSQTDSVELIDGGKIYFESLKRLIDEAVRVLHLQVYIFDDDNIGKQIAQHLKNAVTRGVQVFVLVDEYGSGDLPEEFITEMEAGGVQFRKFQSFRSGKKYQLGRRLHHKVTVADERIALLGGINIADRYHGSLQEPAWLDFGVLVTGEVCRLAHAICEDIWEKKYFAGRRKLRKIIASEDGVVKVRLVQNDWLKGRIGISRSYRQAISNAKDEVTIFASYFIPGRSIRRRLRTAALRGVKVRIVVAQQSDLFLVKRATNYLYRWMLRHKIELYEWRRSVLHAKVAVIDNQWTTIGSYNLNLLSDYGSIELNLDILDNDFAAKTNHRLNQLIKEGCDKITWDDYQSRKTLAGRLLDWAGYRLARILLRIVLQFTEKSG